MRAVRFNEIHSVEWSRFVCGHYQGNERACRRTVNKKTCSRGSIKKNQRRKANGEHEYRL